MNGVSMVFNEMFIDDAPLMDNEENVTSMVIQCFLINGTSMKINAIFFC